MIIHLPKGILLSLGRHDGKTPTGTPSELEDLGLFWSQQATHNALKCHRDARRTTKGLEKLEFEKKLNNKLI